VRRYAEVFRWNIAGLVAIGAYSCPDNPIVCEFQQPCQFRRDDLASGAASGLGDVQWRHIPRAFGVILEENIVNCCDDSPDCCLIGIEAPGGADPASAR